MKHPSLATRRRRTAAVAVSSLGLIAALIGADAAAAVPATAAPASKAATPAASNAAEPIFTEQFEHNVGTAAVMLDDYVGVNGETYTADPAWINAEQCNGVIISDGASSSSCSTSLGALANVLGQVGGTDAATNHAVGAYTRSVNVPANAVQVASVQPTQLGGAGRFISFGVDAAAASCVGYEHPLLNFSLVDGRTEYPVSKGPIDPCEAPNAKKYTVGGLDIMAGSFVSDGGVLFNGDTLKFVMRNAQSSNSGNDGAIDNVRVLDSTPALQNAFDGSSPIVGDTARLTFTVENTTENGAKPGWSFKETLPTGLTIAADPNEAITCADGTVTTTPGASDISVSGDLATGAASCTISVDVTSKAAGTYTVDDSTVAAHDGVNLPSSASVTFVAEDNALALTDTATIVGGNNDQVADLGERVKFDYRATNNGNVAVSGLTLASSNGAVTCAATDLAPGASTDCVSAEHEVTQDDVDAGTIADTATATATSRGGASVSSDASASVATTEQAAATGLALSTVITAEGDPGVGDEVGLQVVVENTGNVTLNNITATIANETGFTVDCAAGALAPGKSTTCAVTGKYTVTQSDVDRGEIVFAAASNAVDPKGQNVTANATATQATVAAAPAITERLTTQLAETGAAKPGDPVTLNVQITNTGNVTLHDIASSIPDSDLQVSCPVNQLAPGEETDCTVTTYPLTQADIDAGQVTFKSTSTGTAPAGDTVTAEAVAGVTVEQAAAVDTTVVAHLADSKHKTPVTGDHVTATATVTNTGNVTLTSISAVLADGPDVTCDTTTLAPGETAECEITDHVLTQDDIERGTVTFALTATGTAPEGSDVSADDTTTVGLTANSSLFLEATWSPSAKTTVQSGDTISSSYVVTNTSNLVAKNVEINDERIGDVVCVISELAPGASTDCSDEKAYTVTDTDTAAGGISFAAKAQAAVVRADGTPDDLGSTDNAADKVSMTTTAKAERDDSTPVIENGTNQVLVFSNEVTKKIPAAAPIELAFTGSEVLTIAVPIAIVLVLAGLVLWLYTNRRRNQGVK